MPLLSQRQYAAHRKALGMSGGSRKAVQDALSARRIEIDPTGKIDSTAADRMWEQRTNPAKQIGFRATPSESERVQSQPNNLDERERIGKIAALETIAGPQQVLHFAEVCLRLGCTPKQAFCAAQLHGCVALRALRDVDGAETDHIEDPSAADWVKLLGPINFNEADALFEAATLPETAPAESRQKGGTKWKI